MLQMANNNAVNNVQFLSQIDNLALQDLKSDRIHWLIIFYESPMIQWKKLFRILFKVSHLHIGVNKQYIIFFSNYSFNENHITLKVWETKIIFKTDCSKPNFAN